MHRRGALCLLVLPLVGLGCDPSPTGLTDVVFENTSPVRGDDLIAQTRGSPKVEADQIVGLRWIWELDGLEYKCMDDFDWSCPDLARACSKVSDASYSEDMSKEEKDSLGNVIPGDMIEKGQAWRVVVRPIDDTCDTGPATSRSITVINTPPTSSVSIEPSSPKSHDDLLASGVGQDSDGDTVRFSYVWTKKGSSSSTELQGAQLDSSETRSGEVWLVSATPFDTEDGETSTSEVTIGNAKPVVESIEILQSAPQVLDDIVVAATFSDEEADAITVSVIWTLVDGETRTELKRELLEAPLDEAPESTTWFATLESGLFVKDQLIEVELIASDEAPSDARSTTVLTVNTPPELIETPGPLVIASSDVDAGEISRSFRPDCSWDETTFSDPDGDLPAEESYRITWEVIGSGSGTYDDADFDENSYIFGNNLQCTVEPSDGQDFGAPLTSASVRVTNASPQITLDVQGYDSSTGLGTGSIPTSAQDAFANGLVEDLDGNDISNQTYIWSVNGTQVSSVSSVTLDNSLFARGDLLEVAMTATDTAGGTGHATGSATVQNSPPSLNNVRINPTDLYTDSSITGVALGVDEDGDSYVTTYTWTVGTSRFVSTTSAFPSTVAKGDLVTLSVVLDDNYTVASLTSVHGTASTAVTHGPVTVQDSAPVMPSLVLNPISPIEGLHDASCEFESGSPSDADGDTVSTSWAITQTRSGSVVTSSTATGTTGPSIAAAGLIADDVITCTATGTASGLSTQADSTDTVLASTVTYVILPEDLASDSSDFCNTDTDIFVYNQDIELTWTDTYPGDTDHIPTTISVELNWAADYEQNETVPDYERQTSLNGISTSTLFSIGSGSTDSCAGTDPDVTTWDLSPDVAAYVGDSDNTLTVFISTADPVLMGLGESSDGDWVDESTGDPGIGLVTVSYD